MLQVLKFIFEQVVAFLAMLFRIDVGDGFSLGLVMCVVFIFLPIVLKFVNFLKTGLFDELDERYDERAISLFQYHGKHEQAGRHSKEYFRRKRRSEKEWVYLFHIQ